MLRNSYLETDLLPYLFTKPPPNTVYSLMLGSEDAEFGFPCGCMKGTALKVYKPVHIDPPLEKLISLKDLINFIDALNEILEATHIPSLPWGLILLPPISILCIRKLTRYRRQYQLNSLLESVNKQLATTKVFWKLCDVPPEKFIAGVVIAHLIEKEPEIPQAVMPSVIGLPMLPKYSNILYDSAPLGTVFTLRVHVSCGKAEEYENNCCFGSVSRVTLQVEEVRHTQLETELRQLLPEESLLRIQRNMNYALQSGLHLSYPLGFFECLAERDRLIDAAISTANADLQDLPVFWVRSVVPVSMLTSSAPIAHLIFHQASE